MTGLVAHALLTALLFALGPEAPTLGGQGQHTADYSAPGAYEVETVQQIVLRDEKRKKDLPVFVSFPKGDGPFPVIVFSHGAGGSGDVGFPIVRHWTSHGYVVLCPTHDDSIRLRRRRGETVEGGAAALIRRAITREEDWINRPRDVSFLLDSLDEIEKQAPTLQGRLDRQRVGVGGHSLGAYTAQVAGGATVKLGGQDAPQSFADQRIQAVLQLSGQGSQQNGLHKGSWNEIRIPMMCVTGSLDRGAQGQDPLWRREPFEYAAPGGKYFLFVEGAHHGSFTGKRAEGAVDARVERLRNPSPELRRRLEQRLGRQLTDNDLERLRERLTQRSGAAPGASGPVGNQSEIFDWVKQATTAFWDAWLKGDADARAWLDSDALLTAAGGKLKLERK